LVENFLELVLFVNDLLLQAQLGLFDSTEALQIQVMLVVCPLEIVYLGLELCDRIQMLGVGVSDSSVT
jgi:hypothetical protein